MTRTVRMFAKLAVIIIAVGLIACALLAIRQSRMHAAHELAQTRLRIAEEDARLWDLRARIATRVTPTSIYDMAASMGPMAPITPDMGVGLQPPQAAVASASRANPERAR